MSIDKDILDRLMEGRAPGDLFGKDGILSELTKALAERALSTEMEVHLDEERAEEAPEGRVDPRRQGEDRRQDDEARQQQQGAEGTLADGPHDGLNAYRILLPGCAKNTVKYVIQTRDCFIFHAQPIRVSTTNPPTYTSWIASIITRMRYDDK